jgi:hypothetical protein
MKRSIEPGSPSHFTQRACVLLALCAVAHLGACKKHAPKADTLSVDQAHPPDRIPGLEVVATLERTGCFGECPVYRLTVESDGTVVYVGTRWVKVTGRQQYQLRQAQLAALQSAFIHADFMHFHDYDHVEGTDDDWAHLSFQQGTTVKRVRHYHGDSSAPAALTALEDDFDRIVGSGRLIGLPSTAPSASAERE